MHNFGDRFLDIIQDWLPEIGVYGVRSVTGIEKTPKSLGFGKALSIHYTDSDYDPCVYIFQGGYGAMIESLMGPEPCPYTHSHTRHWCGNEGCRDA